MDVQYMDMQTQTWRKWTIIWRESVYVHSQTTCHVSGLSIYCCHAAFVLIFFFLPVFFCSKESLCGQRGLLPNTDIQTFQVSLTNRVRLQHERIREPISRVSALFFVFIEELLNIKPIEKPFPIFMLYGCLSPPLQRGGQSRLIDACSANEFEQKTRAYHTMNHFLGSFIDHVSSIPQK